MYRDLESHNQPPTFKFPSRPKAGTRGAGLGAAAAPVEDDVASFPLEESSRPTAVDTPPLEHVDSVEGSDEDGPRTRSRPARGVEPGAAAKKLAERIRRGEVGPVLSLRTELPNCRGCELRLILQVLLDCVDVHMLSFGRNDAFTKSEELVDMFVRVLRCGYVWACDLGELCFRGDVMERLVSELEGPTTNLAFVFVDEGCGISKEHVSRMKALTRERRLLDKEVAPEKVRRTRAPWLQAVTNFGWIMRSENLTRCFWRPYQEPAFWRSAGFCCPKVTRPPAAPAKWVHPGLRPLMRFQRGDLNAEQVNKMFPAGMGGAILSQEYLRDCLKKAPDLAPPAFVVESAFRFSVVMQHNNTVELKLPRQCDSLLAEGFVQIRLTPNDNPKETDVQCDLCGIEGHRLSVVRPRSSEALRLRDGWKELTVAHCLVAGDRLIFTRERAAPIVDVAILRKAGDKKRQPEIAKRQPVAEEKTAKIAEVEDKGEEDEDDEETQELQPPTSKRRKSQTSTPEDFLLGLWDYSTGQYRIVQTWEGLLFRDGNCEGLLHHKGTWWRATLPGEGDVRLQLSTCGRKILSNFRYQGRGPWSHTIVATKARATRATLHQEAASSQ